MREYLKKLPIISLLLALIMSYTPLISYANSSNQNTGDISIQVDQNHIKVNEKFKVVLENDNIRRDLSIKSSEINNISAHLVFPTRENLEFNIESNGKNTSINIPVHNEKGKEVVITLSYSIERTNALSKSLANKEEVDLIYPATNTPLARLNIDLQSNVSGVEDYSDKIFMSKDHSEESKKPNITQNNLNNKPTEPSKSKSVIWTFIKTVVGFIFDLIVLLLCCFGIVVLGIAGYIFYCRYHRRKNKKFYVKSKKQKKSFNTQKRRP